jgi:hypothetical protein
MRAFDLAIACGVSAALATALAACSSSHGGGACGGVDGVYEITLSGTGQQEVASASSGTGVVSLSEAGVDADVDGGLLPPPVGGIGAVCPGSGAAQVIDLTVSRGQVSLNGETCAICASAGCAVDIVCGDAVTCPDIATPPAAPADTYVQTLTFVVPGAVGATTGNAVAALGPNFCGYAGTAVLKSR